MYSINQLIRMSIVVHVHARYVPCIKNVGTLRISVSLDEYFSGSDLINSRITVSYNNIWTEYDWYNIMCGLLSIYLASGRTHGTHVKMIITTPNSL